MDRVDHRIIRRVLRVNHSGETGAISIYENQIRLAHARCADLIPWLESTLAHEKRHQQLFFDAMQPRNAKPCRALSVWRIGGAILGAVTTLFGRTGVLVCTAAVERTVHRHLINQLDFLRLHDQEIAAIVSDVLKDEIEHLNEAKRLLEEDSVIAPFLAFIISIATEALILISTRGDSFLLHKKMRN